MGVSPQPPLSLGGVFRNPEKEKTLRGNILPMWNNPTEDLYLLPFTEEGLGQNSVCDVDKAFLLTF